MSWKPVAAIPVLFRQINERWPNRDKRTDGVIGDADHQARESDHNPDENGWVHAMDIDKDLNPGGADDAERLANELLEYARLRKPGSNRLKNIVFRDRVASGTYPDKFWVWRPNTKLEHFDHIHVSYTDGTELDGREFDLPIFKENEDMPLTDEEIEKIATRAAHKVWNTLYNDPIVGQQASTASILVRTRMDANTSAKNTAAPGTGISDADAAKIADAVVDEQADRLKD